jgi:hypothetical protein
MAIGRPRNNIPHAESKISTGLKWFQVAAFFFEVFLSDCNASALQLPPEWRILHHDLYDLGI